MYEIYTISGAPRPWRVLLGLVAKGLAFETHVLDASKNEHKAPAFLALNPRGRTPVLRDGDLVVTESLAILAYLDRAHPERPLFGTTAKEHARIWEIASQADGDFANATNAFLGSAFAGTEDENVRKAAELVRAELRWLEETLGDAAHLAGDRISAADCVAFPNARLTVRAGERQPELMRRLELHPLADAYPRVAAWVKRIESLPGYAKTYPPHW